MELKTCKSCKRLYNHFTGQNLCPSCTAKYDEIYHNVKEYVYDNPNATIQEVADEFEITVKTIHTWIREERLEFAGTSAVGLPCEGCGTMLRSGKYCDACKKSMIESLSSAYKPKMQVTESVQKKNDTKMRFF